MLRYCRLLSFIFLFWGFNEFARKLLSITVRSHPKNKSNIASKEPTIKTKIYTLKIKRNLIIHQVLTKSNKIPNTCRSITEISSLGSMPMHSQLIYRSTTIDHTQKTHQLVNIKCKVIASKTGSSHFVYVPCSA